MEGLIIKIFQFFFWNLGLLETHFCLGLVLFRSAAWDWVVTKTSGHRIFTCISISMGVRRYWLNFQFGAICSLKCSRAYIHDMNHTSDSQLLCWWPPPRFICPTESSQCEWKHLFGCAGLLIEVAFRFEHPFSFSALCLLNKTNKFWLRKARERVFKDL